MPLSVSALAVCELKVNGAAVAEDVHMQILECVVDESIYLPSACTIRFAVDPTHDHGLDIVDGEMFAEGSMVEVSMGYFDTQISVDSKATVFKGEIVGTDLDLNAMSPSTFTIRALDKSHRMHIGVNQKVYLNVSDSDCISQVVAANGLSADVSATDGVRDWIVQNNQTDWDFVKHLAWRNGMRLYMDRSETVVAKSFDSTASDVTIEWAEDVLAFRPRTAASTQIEKVNLRSWDMKTKAVLIGASKGSPAVPSAAEKMAGKRAGSLFKSQPTTIVGFPLFDQGSADAMADALYQTIAAEYLKADALCNGSPQLVPGAKADIKGVGARFSGTYTLTTATHVYGPKVGYTTQIGIDGGFGAGLHGLLGGGGGGGGGASSSSGASTGNGSVSSGLNSANLQVSVGIVTNLNDPENIGRVKLNFPFLADESESYWARIATPMAGNGRGFMYLPEIGDEVLVAFEHGDMHRPFIIGALWNGKDAPPEANNVAVVDNQVVHRLIKTRIGHSLLFDDTDGEGQILATTNGGHTFVLDDKNKMIQAQTTGKHILTMDDQNKQIHVKTTGGLDVMMDDNAPSITIKDPAGNQIQIDGASNKISLTSMGDISLSAQQNIDMTAQMNISIQGLAISANAQSTISMVATADMTLQAQADATLMSSGELTIQGTMVMIN